MAKLSERAGVGIAQEIAEPLVNTSTSITSDTSAFSRSDAGVSIVAISSPNAIIAKRVQSQYSPTDKESYSLLVSPGNNAWIDAQARFPFITSATAKYGMRITVISATQVDVEFGGDGPSAGESWSSYTSWKWKLLKHRDGGTINTGEASATRSGLISTGTQTFVGDKTFSGNTSGRGIVPVGAVIAIANSAAWSLPGANAIKDGYALCNGQVFPSGSNPAFTGTMPDLTDDRFLQGSTSAGATGGSTSKTTTGIAATFDKNVMNSDQNAHSHTFDKNVMNSNQNGHNHILPFHYDSSWNPYLVVALNGAGRPLFGSSSFTTNQNDRFINTTNMGTVTRPDLANSSTSTITWNSATVTTSSPTITWNSATVSTTVTQGSISDVRPKYFNVVYVMRVS